MKVPLDAAQPRWDRVFHVCWWAWWRLPARERAEWRRRRAFAEIYRLERAAWQVYWAADTRINVAWAKCEISTSRRTTLMVAAELRREAALLDIERRGKLRPYLDAYQRGAWNMQPDEETQGTEPTVPDTEVESGEADTSGDSATEGEATSGA